VRNEPLETVDLTGNSYDVVLMNGCLHYVRDKSRVLSRVIAVSAVHAVAVFSTATPVPAEHAVVPVFPEEEGGVVERFYQEWDMLLRAYERGRRERSHPGFGPHVHSHIKLIAARSTGRAGDQ
jgi:SAM-dependent methyltransferase